MTRRHRGRIEHSIKGDFAALDFKVRQHSLYSKAQMLHRIRHLIEQLNAAACLLRPSPAHTLGCTCATAHCLLVVLIRVPSLLHRNASQQAHISQLLLCAGRESPRQRRR